MIGDGRFQAQLATVEEILNVTGLLEERQQWPNKTLGASHFRGMTYRQVYEEYIREYAYDFRLVDQALLLFVKAGRNEHDGLLGYSYIECPLPVLSYRDFVGEQFGLTPLDEDFDGTVAEWGDDLRRDYEQYVTSVEAKGNVTPIRYDYKATDYREGLHPASHVHFGFGNDIRVATRRIMNPLSFALLVIRQRYPRAWERVLEMADCPIWCRNVRAEIDDVSDDYWRERDEHEVWLH